MNHVIAEIGINHAGELSVAKTLIDQAKASGCWGVKFQYRHVSSFYKKKDEVSDTTVFEEIKKNNLTLTDLMSLGRYCKVAKIKFGISFFRSEDVDRISKLFNLIDFVKVPSCECLNTSLIEQLLSTGKKVFLSAGGSDTKKVLKVLQPYKKNVVLLHCVSNYPTLLGSQDMRVIKTFTENGFANVGYSSHDSDWEVCLIALSEGANWIERHITLNKTENGLDHSSSSTLDEFKKLVHFANEYINIVGSAYHLPNHGELINLQSLGTSLYAKRNLKVGEKTSSRDYEIKAPRTGLSVGDFIENYERKALLRDLKQGEVLTKNNFSSFSIRNNDKIKRFARCLNLGLPVRLHDYDLFKNEFDLNTYEFHLSFDEALLGNFKRAIAKIDKDENISIHLPDYIPGNNLVDPISSDKDIRAESRKIIERVNSFAKAIEDKLSKRVRIVGSFSNSQHQNKNINLDRIFEYIQEINTNILPQWLPVYAWYFGGTVKLNLFNSYEDIEYLKKHNLNICLDLSHLVMASIYHKVDWKVWYGELLPCVEHVHISDAANSQTEGLTFGEGIIGDFSEILMINKLKIIECWQGHLNHGEGFKRSLSILERQFSTSDGYHASN